MKRLMELNGVANIKLLIDELKNLSAGSYRTAYKEIQEQLDLLERYMVAYNRAINKGEPTPYWHEVRENPSKYPLNREIAD